MTELVSEISTKGDKGKIHGNEQVDVYISVTREREQVTPFQDWPHGSPPLALHWVS